MASGHTPERTTGTYVTTSVAGEPVRAFVPHALPPDPPLQLKAPDLELLERANLAVGRLDGVAKMIPETSLFLYFYVRKEAVLSSQIEGTQSSLADLLLYESKQTPGVPIDDVEEVSSYVAALNHGLKRMRGGFPLSLRLLRETHSVLMRTGRGSTKQPGEFRRSQNWIGGSGPSTAAFVPPPPDKVVDLMGALEKFMHNEPTPTSSLIKAGLAHVQFETIHPFLDGNGRLGRLLITLLLCAKGALKEPLLYLSLYFKKHRNQYYELLQRIRTEGAWEEWLEFFLKGTAATAQEAADTATRVLELFSKDREKIKKLGRSSTSALRVHEYMQRKPIASIAATAKALKLSIPTVTVALNHLMRIGIVEEVTGKRRDRLFTYSRYFNIVSEGTEPLRR